MERTTLMGAFAIADRHYGVGLLDEAIDGQRRAAHEVVVLDLPVERVLSRQMFVTG